VTTRRRRSDGKPNYPSLKAYRKANAVDGRPLPQAVAARRVGISQASWQRIETGQEMPRTKTIKRLVRLGISLHRLIGVPEVADGR
jgi:predicted transcriptional regulator